jgi:hypothetical protein
MYKNGHNGLNGVDVSESPFLSPRNKEERREIKDEFPQDSLPVEAADDAKLPPVEKKKSHGLRNTLILCVIVLGLVGALGFYALYGGRKTLDYRISERKSAAPGGKARAGAGDEPAPTNQITDDAIHQAKEELRKSGAVPAGSPAPAATPETTPPDVSQTAKGPLFQPFPILSPAVPPAANQAAKGGMRVEGASDQSGAEPLPRSAGGNPRQSLHGSSQAATHSIYVVGDDQRRQSNAGQKEGARAPSFSNAGAASFNSPSLIRSVTVPSFGSMIPVRTLGKIYTLRSSLARLEVTRDIEGDGWTLKRGTTLVAKQQGSEHDRAYLSLMGFIDPATNRFVKLGGDLLGSDGAPGLKGQKKRVNGRWAAVFNRVASGALQLGQAALSRGNTTIIVPGSLGGVGSDFGFNSRTLTQREFIEVSANAPAYVLITDLPAEVRGEDAEPNTTGDDFLADDELAELLSSGQPEQIKAALPRMPPEMRKVALLVLGEKQQR